MNTLRTLRLALTLCSGAILAPQVMADDIDIFLGQSGGTSDAANVMILIDNGPNWARQSQGWTDPISGAAITQGQAELNAIAQVLSYLQTQRQSINVGLALLTPNSGGNGTGGGYIRFGARDISVAQTATTLGNILQLATEPCINGSGQANENLAGVARKDVDAALY